MTPEEYKQFKEAEKEHLRALKKLKEQARRAQRRKSVNQALENMVGGAQASFNVHEEMMDKLAIETAQQEARLEIAMENTTLEETARSQTPSPEQLEEEMLKERAKMLLEQMKLQMGMATTTAPDETPSKTLSKHAVPKRPSVETETPASEATENPLPPVDRVAVSPEAGRHQAQDAIASGQAFDKFVELVEAQHGDPSVLTDPASRAGAAPAAEVRAPDHVRGYVADLDALALGYTAVALGAGRRAKEDRVDPTAGIVLHKKPGDAVAPGEVLAHLYTKKTDEIVSFSASVQTAYRFSDTQAPPARMLLDRYTKDGWMKA